MLTYTPHSSQTQPENIGEYPWALLLMVFAWLWPGVFSHDAWNPGEPQLFQVVAQFAQQASWQPMLFEQPYFEVAPIYVWVAATLKALLSPWAVDEFAAVRLTSVLFTVVGLLGSGMAGFRLLGQHQGRSVVLILIGSVGLLPIAHFVHGFSVLFAAVGLILWALAIIQKQLGLSAILCASGLVLLMQAAGLLLPLAVLLVVGCLMWHPLWQSNRLRLFLSGSLAIGLPLMAIYPLALRVMQPEQFALYVHQHLWGVWGGNQNVQAGFALFYFAEHLMWFAFPALPLAIWTATRTHLWQERYGVLLCIWLAVMSVVLSTMPDTNQDYLLLLLVPLAILGAAQLDSLRRGAAAFLNWFGIMTFGLAAVFLWVGFVAMNFGFPAKLAQRAAYFSPYYTRDLDVLPIVFAVLFFVVWLFAINRRRIRGRQAVTNWAAGVTLVWALLMTLFLPWLDAAKSYRPVVQEMQHQLPENIRASWVDNQECLFIAPDDTVTRIAWLQYSTLKFHTDTAVSCRYQLQHISTDFRLPEQAHIVWQGHRPRSKEEVFALIDYQR